MKRTLFASVIVFLFAAAFSAADTFGTGANQFTIDFVPIWGATNPVSGISGYGFTFTGVATDYRMGTYEITDEHWAKFEASCGTVVGSPQAAYDYEPSWTGWNYPIDNVSWYEAAQFVNWLNTSTGHQAAYKFIGTQGTNDYTFEVWDATDAGYNPNNPYRNSNAYYFLPTENEWVKAAYWNGTTLQQYATKAGETLYKGNGSNGGWNYRTNIYAGPGSPWRVGRGSRELNGTYDMMGNIREWIESPYTIGNYTAGANRVIRGGDFDNFNNSMLSINRSYTVDGAATEIEYLGFRVASVPEPGTMGLVAVGALALARKRRRRDLASHDRTRLRGGNTGVFRRAKTRKALIASSVLLLFTATFASADTFGTGTNQFEIEFVTISGDASSANGTNISRVSEGHVFHKVFSDPGNYRISKFEITNDQLNKFVHSCGAPTGNPSYAYDNNTYLFTRANMPANSVSWYEAAQFVNWLNTSNGFQAAYKFVGVQGTSDYTFTAWDAMDTGYSANNPFRNSNAFYFLPTEDEWIKAAFWNGTILQEYATKAGESLHQGDGISGTGWNYYNGYQYATNPWGLWDVGSGSEELNGTYDMMGNAWEFVETEYYDPFLSESDRIMRGGAFSSSYRDLRSYERYYVSAWVEHETLGFRVASIPEPATLGLLAVGGLMLVRKRTK